MKFISQPYGSKQCGQACLAMILNWGLNDICASLNKFWHTTIEDLSKHLNHSGYKVELFKTDYGFYRFEDVPNNSIIRFYNYDGTGHFVIKYDDKYYDPSIGIVEKYYKDVKINMYLTYEKIETT